MLSNNSAMLHLAEDGPHPRPPLRSEHHLSQPSDHAQDKFGKNEEAGE
jgi:hypothetical protein